MTSLNGTGALGVQLHDPWQWLFVGAALAVLGYRVLRAWQAGDGRQRPFDRFLDGAGKRARLAPWAAVGVNVALWALGVAFVGFMWDVAWPADTGRDKELFTVPHVLILIGLFGILAAGVLSL